MLSSKNIKKRTRNSLIVKCNKKPTLIKWSKTSNKTKIEKILSSKNIYEKNYFLLIIIKNHISTME